MWKNQKNSLCPDLSTATARQKHQYELWKSHFISSVNEYYNSKYEEINTHYSALIPQDSGSSSYAQKVSEISLLLRKMFEAGFSVSTVPAEIVPAPGGAGFTFIVSELLSPPSKEAEALFARFASEFKHLASLGAACSSEMLLLDKTLTVTYCISVPCFAAIREQLDSVIKYYSNHDDANDYLKDTFETAYADSLEKNDANIEEAIRTCLKL